MASRGVDTLRFGPMKPVGLVDPRTGREPYAVVQLRQDNLAGDHFSLVGFQTQMKWGEQARVLKLIPGLEQAEFVRFGMIHRNTYINGPTVLRETWQTRIARRPVLRRTDFRRRGLRRVGGVGSDGRPQRRRAGRSAEPIRVPPRTTAHRRAGVLRVARRPAKHYQPTNITFGIMPPLEPAGGRQAAAKEGRAQGARCPSARWPIWTSGSQRCAGRQLRARWRRQGVTE